MSAYSLLTYIITYKLHTYLNIKEENGEINSENTMIIIEKKEPQKQEDQMSIQKVSIQLSERNQEKEILKFNEQCKCLNCILQI